MLTRSCSLWSSFCHLWEVAELIEEHLGSSWNRWPHFLSSRYCSVFTENSHAPHPHSEAFTPSPVSLPAIWILKSYTKTTATSTQFWHRLCHCTPPLPLLPLLSSPTVSSAHYLPTRPICLSFLQILPPLKLGFYPENSWEVENTSLKCTG